MWLSFACFSLIITTLLYFYVVQKRKKTQSKGRVMLFCRFPEPGKTKTRLIAELGEAGSSRAALHMADHMLDILSEFQQRRTDTTVEVKLSGGTAKQIDHWLGRKRFPRGCFSWSSQCDGHLGIKMADAFDNAFKKGTEVAVIIGCDIPSINPDLLDAALATLSNPGCDMVLGPARDGGYYLIGLKREVTHKSGVLGGLFEGIEWGTSSVRQQQLEVATQLGIKVELMPQVLQDVDTPDDLVEFERAVGMSIADLKAPTLSVVMPVLNEEANIEGALRCIMENSSWLSYIEVIVSDGGSIDDTLEIVDRFAEENPDIKIKSVQSSTGRGPQLNTGAREASGVNLLFLHADTRIPWAFDRHVLLTLAVPGNVAGAFNLGCDVLHPQEGTRHDCSWWVKKQLQIMELFVRISCRFSEIAYGDQAIFMSRRTFERVGQYPPYLLMEDYAMVKKLLHIGHLRIIKDVFAITSARRLLKKGIIKAVIINKLMVLGYNLGIHPDKLARFYYG